MAEVTGDLGGQPIQLNNAATETTLRQLLAVMMAQTAKNSKQSLKDEKELRKELQALADAAKKTSAEHAKYRDKLAEEIKDKEGKKARQEQLDSYKKIGKELQNFVRGIDSTVKSITNFTSGLASMGNSVSSATNSLNAIPVVGGMLATTLGAVAKEAERQQKAFQQATAVGATFSGGITEMVNSASRMGLTFDQFSGIVNKSGKDLALLGEGSASGAKQLVKYATAMRNSGLQDDLARLGFSAEDITESLAKYGAQLKTIGYSQAQIDATLVQSTGEYLKNLDAVSKITGLNRKDLEKQRADRMRDSQFRAMMIGKDKETVDSMNGLMDLLGESQAKGFKEIASTGTAMGDEAKALFTTAPQLAQAAMDAYNSLETTGRYTMSQATATHTLAQREARDRIETLKFLGRFGDETQKRMAVGAMDVGAQTLGFAEALEKTEAAAKEASKNDPAALMRLQQQTAEISNKASLLLSDQFNKLSSIMQKFYEVLNDYVIPTLEWATDNIGLTIGAMIGAKVGLEVFKLMLSKAFGGIAGGGASSILTSALKFVFSAVGLKLLLAGGAIYGLFTLAKQFSEGKNKQMTLKELDEKHKAGTLTPEEAQARDALRASGVTATPGEAQRMARRNSMKIGEAAEVVGSKLTDEEIKKEYGFSRKVLAQYVMEGGKKTLADIAKELGETMTGFIEQGSTGERTAASLPTNPAAGPTTPVEIETPDTDVMEDVNAAERERLAILEADKSLKGRIAFAEAQRKAREAAQAKEQLQLNDKLIDKTKEELAVAQASGACKGYDFSSPDALFKSFREKNMQPGASSVQPQRGTAATGTAGTGTLGPVGGLGFIAEKYESGGRGSETVGWDKSGGTSYGKKQISSKAGAMTDYLKFLEKTGKGDIAKRLREAGIEKDTGSTSGKAVDVWKEIAKSGALGDSETEFLKTQSYDVSMNRLNDKDLKARIEKSKALQEMMYSTSVQHGGGGGASIFNKVYKKGMSDEELIKAVYAERGAEGGQRHFASSSEKERAGVVNRFGREQADILALLKNPELATAGATAPKPPTTSAASTAAAPPRPPVTPTATAVTSTIAPTTPVAVPGRTTPNQPGTGAPGAGGATPANEIAGALERLNSMTAQLVGYNKDVAETSRLQLSAIKSIGKVY